MTCSVLPFCQLLKPKSNVQTNVQTSLLSVDEQRMHNGTLMQPEVLEFAGTLVGLSWVAACAICTEPRQTG